MWENLVDDSVCDRCGSSYWHNWTRSENRTCSECDNEYPEPKLEDY